MKFWWKREKPLPLLAGEEFVSVSESEIALSDEVERLQNELLKLKSEIMNLRHEARKSEWKCREYFNELEATRKAFQIAKEWRRE